jgi:hypothetical protein
MRTLFTSGGAAAGSLADGSAGASLFDESASATPAANVKNAAAKKSKRQIISNRCRHAK